MALLTPPEPTTITATRHTEEGLDNHALKTA